MRFNSEKYYPWVKHTTIALDVLFLVVLLVNYFGYLPEFWNILYIFYFVLTVNTGFLALRINKIPENERENNTWIYLTGHLFILILIVLGVNQFLQREIVNDYLAYIIGFAISAGFLTFYSHQNKVEKELEDEKDKEEAKEKKRKDEFSTKFKTLSKFNLSYGFAKVIHSKNDSLFNKILKLIILTIACPFIFLIRLPYSITNWMYKEGWWYSVGLILIVILGACFYFYGLGGYGFQGDEYYHAKVAKVYFEQGKLFSLGEESYTRANLVSLMPIISKYFFNFLSISPNIEFIYRLPIVIFSIISIIFIYFISKVYISKYYALIITLLYTTEIWFIYFAKYLRFYAPSLTLILAILFINLKYKDNKKIILLSLFISIILYLILTNYFALLIIFLTYLLSLKYIKEGKSKLVYLIITVLSIFLLLEYIRTLFFVQSTYNSAVINWNASNILNQIKWFIMNYPIYFIIFTSGITFNNLRNNLYQYTLFNLLFFLFYINNAEFNFSFRPIYFFLPLIFICVGIILIKKGFNKKYLILIVIFLISINLIQIYNYSLDSPGDQYYPTKLIYEKMEMIEGIRDIATYLGQNSDEDTIIITIGLESIDQYYDKSEIIKYSYSTQNGDSNSIKDLDKYVIENENKKIFVVIFASAQDGRINYLYYHIYGGRQYVTEASPAFLEYVQKSPDFQEVYISKDGYSRVFELK